MPRLWKALILGVGITQSCLRSPTGQTGVARSPPVVIGGSATPHAELTQPRRPRIVPGRLPDEVNVKEFGALGDGVSDDTQAIQQAITSALANEAGEVVFPYGIYLVSTPIEIGTRPGSSAAKLRLRGLGTGGNAGSGAVVKAGPRFRGDAVLRFDHGPLPAGGEGVQLSIAGLTVDCGSVAPEGVYINSPIMVTMERIAVWDPTDVGIHLSGGEDGGYSVYLRDIYVHGSDPRHVAHPAKFGIYSTARFARYERVVMDGSRTGIYFSGDAVTITGSHLEGQATSIELNTSGRGLSRITENYINAYGAGQGGWPESGTGIRLAGDGPGAALQNFITGNVIISSTGIAPVGISFENSYQAIVMGNYVDAPVGISTNGAPGPDRNWVVDANVFTGMPVSHNVNGGAVVYSAANIMATGADPSFGGNARFVRTSRGYALDPDAQTGCVVPFLAAASGVTVQVAAPGASLGDYAMASFDGDLGGVTLSAQVNAPGFVSVRFQNPTAAGVPGAGGTLRVRVIQHDSPR